MSTAVASSPLREVTNEMINREVVAKKPVNWNGVHLKFDEDGNSEAVMKSEEIVVPTEAALPLVESDEEDEDYAPSESSEEEDLEEEETVDSNEEETEDNQLWAIREQAKVSWCGKHTVFKDDEETEEDDHTTQAPSQEVDALEAALSQMTTEH